MMNPVEPSSRREVEGRPDQLNISFDEPFALDDIGTIKGAVEAGKTNKSKIFTAPKIIQTVLTGIGAPLVAVGIMGLASFMIAPPLALSVALIAIGGALIAGSLLMGATLVVEADGNVLKDFILPQLGGAALGIGATIIGVVNVGAIVALGMTAAASSVTFTAEAMAVGLIMYLIAGNLIGLPGWGLAAGGAGALAGSDLFSDNKVEEDFYLQEAQEDHIEGLTAYNKPNSDEKIDLLKTFNDDIPPNPFEKEASKGNILNSSQITQSYDEILKSLRNWDYDTAIDKMDKIIGSYMNDSEPIPQYILQGAIALYAKQKQDDKAKYLLFQLAQGQIDEGRVSLNVLNLVLEQIPESKTEREDLLHSIISHIDTLIEDTMGNLNKKRNAHKDEKTNSAQVWSSLSEEDRKQCSERLQKLSNEIKELEAKKKKYENFKAKIVN